MGTKPFIVVYLFSTHQISNAVTRVKRQTNLEKIFFHLRFIRSKLRHFLTIFGTKLFHRFESESQQQPKNKETKAKMSPGIASERQASERVCDSLKIVSKFF